MTGREDSVVIDLDVVAEGRNSVRVTDGHRFAWLPRSEIQIVRAEFGPSASITAPRWLLEDRGFDA